MPAGVTAAPQCALQSSTGTDKKCALVCKPKEKENTCGANASCKKVQLGVGVCTYDDSAKSLRSGTFSFAASFSAAIATE